MICTSFESQGNPKPNKNLQHYSYMIHEKKGVWFSPNDGDKIVDNHILFMSVLNDLAYIRIKGVDGKFSNALIDNVILESATEIGPEQGYIQPGDRADWVEECVVWAQSGYTGQYAQMCADGY